MDMSWQKKLRERGERKREWEKGKKEGQGDRERGERKRGRGRQEKKTLRGERNMQLMLLRKRDCLSDTKTRENQVDYNVKVSGKWQTKFVLFFFSLTVTKSITIPFTGHISITQWMLHCQNHSPENIMGKTYYSKYNKI